MPTEVVLDHDTLGIALALLFGLIGAGQGGARSVLSVATSLAVIVGLGEPGVASLVLAVGARVSSVLRRALGADGDLAFANPGPYFFLVYSGVLGGVMLLTRAVVREAGVSRSSRLLGGLLGGLNGLLFALMLRENLLPALGGALAEGVVVRLRLQPEVSATSLPVGGLSVGTVAYLFGLVLAGAGVLRKIRALRGPGQ
ncbi:MAG: hypothetical protein HPY83_15315 [Anaerolineae bacterium]|nr:hypothetical protein [Anaerolineae bacterium]